MAEKKKPETFEEGLSRLESIVNDLEGKSMDLDTAIKAFEEGKRLGDELSRKLEEAEAKLETISKGPDGRPAAVPMAPPGESADEDH